MPDNRVIPPAELEAFVKKVEKLKAEGLTVSVIARRLCLDRGTVNERLRMHKRQQKRG